MNRAVSARVTPGPSTETTESPAPTVHRHATPPATRRIVAAFGALVVASALVGLLVSGDNYKAGAAGLPDAGPIVGWGLPALTGIVFVSAMLTVGSLLLASFLDPDARAGVVSRRGRRALLSAGVAAAIWCVASSTAAAFTLAQILGVPLGTALLPKYLQTYAWDVIGVRTLAISAVIAAVVAIGCFLTARQTTATLWLVLALVAIATPALAGHAAGLGNHAFAIVNGVSHVLAATVWVGGLIALGLLALEKKQHPPAVAVAAMRYSPIALVCFVVVFISGIGNAYARIGDWDDLLYTGYGQLVVAKSVLLAVLFVSGLAMRRRILPQISGPRRVVSFAKLAAVEVAVMGVATGIGVALSLSAPTRPDLFLPSPGEMLLGTPYPPAPSYSLVLLGWHFDPLFLAIGVVGAALYIAGVLRLRARGDHWPISRTICWLLGMSIVIWATNGGIATYAEVSVGYHMIEHMALTMLAPIPIVLAAPVTLALRAIKPSPTGGRGPRELMMGALQSPVAKFMTNPLIVLALFVVGLYGLYFSDLFGILMGSHVGHIAMTAHFLVSGLLLAWVAIGVDPKPKAIPYWSRMLLVLVAVVLHTFFAVALMETASAIGSSWYSLVQPPWITNAVQDSMFGGQIAWAVGEIPGVLMLLIIAVQWSRSDEREAKRRDRYTSANGDIELDEYNEYLAHLAEVNARYEANRRARQRD